MRHTKWIALDDLCYGTILHNCLADKKALEKLGGGKILDCIYSYAYGNRRLHRNCSKVHPRYPLQTLLSDNCTIFVDILAWTFCGGIFGQAASVTEKILVGRNCIFCCMADKID